MIRAGASIAMLMVAMVAARVAPAAAQVAMPDAAQMSGRPLPAPDLPNATVTVRVVRERMGNNLPGQEVVLATPDGRVTAVTDAQGRAEFRGVAAGSTVNAEVTVDGELLRSQAFIVPAQGGMRVALVAGAAKAAEADAEAKAAAAKEPARPGAVVFGSDTRIVLEFQDDKPTIFYLFSVLNNARTPVDPGHPLVMTLPADAAEASLVSGPPTIGQVRGRELTLTGPFPPGPTEFQVAFRLPLSPVVRLSQAFPAPVEGFLVAAEKAGGLRLTSPQLSAIRDGDSNGQSFLMGTGGRIAEGEAITLEFAGLPTPPVWPSRLALALAALCFGWGAWAATRGRPDDQAARSALTAERDRLLGALAAIDAESRVRGSLDARASAKRERLLAAAEQVYADLDALPGGSGSGR